MAFGATITVSYGGANKVLNRINQDNYGSEYYLREATIDYRMKIRHSKESPWLSHPQVSIVITSNSL